MVLFALALFSNFLGVSNAALAAFFIAQAAFDAATATARSIVPVIAVAAGAVNVSPDDAMPHARSAEQVYQQHKNNQRGCCPDQLQGVQAICKPQHDERDGNKRTEDDAMVLANALTWNRAVYVRERDDAH